jgi:rod shape determining protein RodA
LRREDSISTNLDWVSVLIFAAMVLLGWLNIFAAVYDPENVKSIFDLSTNSGKQLLWIGTTVLIVIGISAINYRFFESFSYVIYAFVLVLLIFVLLFGREVAGSKSWFEIGSFRLQPAEFAKYATALAIAKLFNTYGIKIEQWRTIFLLGVILALPMALIVLQGDTGSAMVFAVFILVFFREGLNPLPILLGGFAIVMFVLALLVTEMYIYIGIGVLAIGVFLLVKKNAKNAIIIVSLAVFGLVVVKGVNFIVYKVMKPHQQMRIKAFVNPDADPLGFGWNVTQSKIAIGSGGFWGKGFLKGTQTKFDFVPEQSTDFIFCTVGEEHGWFGSFILVGLFIGLLLRLIFLAERQKSDFARIYGYSVAGIIFFHFFINVGMTVGLVPVVGLPLPFFSYGGSSLWSFTILLFTFLKLDSERSNML